MIEALQAGDRVVLAGGSGFLGGHLARHLAVDGVDVVVLTRSPDRHVGPGRAVAWDGRTIGPWAAELSGARAVVNFAGKSVDCRYTAANLLEIDASRVDSVRVLHSALRDCQGPPPVWVQAASLAILGDSGDEECDESAWPGRGVAVQTCLKWEDALFQEQDPDVRVVCLRISFVLGADGGALERLGTLARCGLGGTVGSGRQWISWLHVDDMNRIFRRAIEDTALRGVVNATGPNPATNREFMRALRRAVHRPWSPPAPAWAVRVGARLMGTEPSLALTGRRGVPGCLEGLGFEWEHPDLDTALASIYASAQ